VATFSPTERGSVAWTGGTLRIAGATDVGCVRSINQDAYGHFHLADRGESLFVVADGLGGHQGGEIASQLAVEVLEKWIGEGEGEPSIRLTRAITAANQSILTAARRDDQLSGMATTIVCLLLDENGRSHVAHVGDSRLYRLRDGRLSGITEDHSLVATLVREGVLSAEDAREDPRRNQLCSDGLNGLIDDNEIHNLLTQHSEPMVLAAALIDAAKQAGGNDNITCLIASLPAPTIFPVLRARAARLIGATRSLFQKARA